MNIVDIPPGISKQNCDPAIPVASVLSRQFDHVSNKPLFVSSPLGDVTLGRSMLAKHATSSTF